MRIVVASTALPPGDSGQAKVLGRLFGCLRELSVTYVSDNDSTFPVAAATAQEHEGVRYVKLDQIHRPPDANSEKGTLRRLLLRRSLEAGVRRRSRELASAVVRDHADVLVACSGNPFDLGGAALASQETGVPVVAYLFDDPIFQWPVGEYRVLAQRLAPSWARAATSTICPNPRLAAQVMLHSSLKSPPVVIYNPIHDDELLAKCPDPTRALPGQPLRILYTGSLYEAQADALRNVAHAIALTSHRVELVIHSPQSAQLRRWGLDLPGVTGLSNLEQNAAMDAQRNADVLVLPLAFNSGIHETIMTSSPGKLGEYLCAGRPILVHAPPGCYLDEFFRETGAGLVVSTDSSQAVRLAIDQLASDAGLCKKLSTAADREKHRFSQRAASATFHDILAGAGKPNA